MRGRAEREPSAQTVREHALTPRAGRSGLLPLTLTFKDFNHVEKIATLPRRLSMDGVAAGADPDIGDIGYYAPSSDLVFYYGDVGYWNGIVRIGRFTDRDIELIERQPDGFQVTLEPG